MQERVDQECEAIDIAREVAAWQPTWAEYVDLFDRHLDIGLSFVENDA